MAKRIGSVFILGFVFAFLASAPGQAQPIGKGAIMPFQIYSQEDLAYLQKTIMETLYEGLNKQKIPLVPLSETAPYLGQKIPGDWNELRAIGKNLGAGWLVYGNLTKIGQGLNLTGNLLDTSSDKAPLTFTMTEEGLENLLKLISKFSREVGLRVLGQEKIAEIAIRGNKRIESQVILKEIKSKVGEAYQPDLLDQDIRAIFNMGYFSDVRLELAQAPQGKQVTLGVVERPFVKRIDITGNKEIKEEELRDQLTLKVYSILNLNTINETLEKLNNHYQSKGYYNARITYTTTFEDQEQAAVLVFTVVEGKKVYIKTISFQGVKGFSEKKLKSLMETNEKDFFYWFTSSGVYKKELLEQDLEKLASFYYNNGYLKARVDEPQVRHEGDWIYISIPVEEGQQFKMGKADIRGDLLQEKEKLVKNLLITKEKYYNREVIRKDILQLSDLYSAEGYAFAEIFPQIQEDLSVPKVDLVYEIKKGSKVYFERIDIVGNVKTRDKVIRREFRVAEKGLFDPRALRRSYELIQRLDYFEEVNLGTSPGSQEDRMNLKVEVKEKMTGSFSIGAGYSAVDGIVFMGQVSERNLFGRGQRLGLDAQLGAKTQRYNLSFVEPWLFDRPLSAGISIYNWVREYDEYTKDSLGGNLDLGHNLWGDYTRGYITYIYDDAFVSNIKPGSAQVIKDQAGRHVTSSVRFTLRRDSRDLLFNTTKGSLNYFSVEYAGGPFGGTNFFTRYIASSGWFFPLFWETTFAVHGKVGYIEQNAGGDLPLYEKFYLGGMNSIRGYPALSISPKDPVTGDKIGGDKMVQLNIEYIFPIIAKAGIKGVLFLDLGNAYLKDETMDFKSLKKSIGAGIRWYSPMGPLRLEFGYNIDPAPGDPSNNWDFTIGTVF